MYCDVCGGKLDRVIVAEIEGARMEVCESCSKLGKVISEKAPKSRGTGKEVMFIPVQGFGALIRETRVRMEMNLKEFSRKLNERESLIRKLEAEDMEPSLKFSDKFYDHFGVRLVEAYEDKGFSPKRTDDSSLTLGDVVKVKEK